MDYWCDLFYDSSKFVRHDAKSDKVPVTKTTAYLQDCHSMQQHTVCMRAAPQKSTSVFTVDMAAVTP